MFVMRKMKFKLTKAALSSFKYWNGND